MIKMYETVLQALLKIVPHWFHYFTTGFRFGNDHSEGMSFCVMFFIRPHAFAQSTCLIHIDANENNKRIILCVCIYEEITADVYEYYSVYTKCN